MGKSTSTPAYRLPTFIWLVVLLGTTACRLNTAAAEDWPRWRGVRGDGTWQGPKLPERWPSGGLPVVWKRAIGGGYSGVVVSDGRACTMDRQKEPDEIERVLCFDAATGKPLWSHRYGVKYGDLSYGHGPRAAPTIHDSRIYTLGAVGHLHCLDAATGKVLWKHDLVADQKAKTPEWGFAASPLIWRDLVIVHAGLQPAGCYSAYNRKTGRPVWNALDDPAGYGTPILIRHNQCDQLVGWTPRHVVGMRPESGKLLWKVPYKVTDNVSIATPIFQDGVVFVAGYWEGSKAIRLGKRQTDAELIWTDKKDLRGLMSQPLYRNGHAFLLDKQKGVTCFHLASGKKRWDASQKRFTPRTRNPQVSMVWLGEGNRAIMLNAEGELILARLDADGFTEQSRTKIIGPTWAHPAYAGQCVFARSNSEMVCVKLTGSGRRDSGGVAQALCKLRVTAIAGNSRAHRQSR